MTSKNAPRPLEVTTPDGSGQVVHPDVVEVPDLLWGHRLWMACTPYPGGYDRVENPILRASDDGVEWKRVDGIPDPIVPTPADPDEHHADPDLVYTNGVLHLVYMTTNKRERHTRFSLTTSVDGVTWSDPVAIHDATWGVSPALVVDDGHWTMWFIELDTSAGFGPSETLRRGGPDLRNLGEPERCSIEIPGHVPWHLDVRRVGSQFEALVSAFPSGRDTSHTRLFHLTSADGVTFGSPILVLEPSGTRWDGRMIYRSSFLADGQGGYRLWYTGGSWNRRFGIGYLEGALGDLQPIDVDQAPLGERFGWLGDTAIGYAKHVVRRTLPDPVLSRLRRG